MILGLDISTRCTGIAITQNEKILLSEAIKLDKIEHLEEKALYLKQRLKEINKDYKIEKIFIEQPIVLFKGGGQAKTTALLQSFNGMMRMVVIDVFGFSAELINSVKARSTLGIKIPKGKKNKHQKKQPIIDFIKQKYGNNFLYELTHRGNFKPGTDDRADALVLCLAGPQLI